MTKIRLSRDAAEFLRREANYIRSRNPAAALAFGRMAKDVQATLRSFPQSGNRMHGTFIPQSRTIVRGDYLWTYIVHGEFIDILAIRHGRMPDSSPKTDSADSLTD